jgi:long-subunit acyl-CoA synthetase (AMP-forming)
MTAPTLADVIAGLDHHPASTLAMASRGGSTELTFAELRERAAEVADRLRALGVGAGSRVGILGASSIPWLTVDLAALVLGAVTVPFEPGHTWDAETLARDWELQVLITDTPSTGAGSDAIELRELSEPSEPAPAARRLTAFRYAAADPFTIKFSSGTSARPKAVAARAQHFDHMARHIDAMFPLGPDDTFVVFGSLATWLQRFMAQLCLTRGARICLARSEAAAMVLERERPTILLGVPRLLESIHRLAERRGGLAAAWGGRMRYLWTGSAPIDRLLLEAYDRAGVPVFEGYGMTETGMIAKNYPGTRRLGSVGKPFPGKEVRLVDGEILVRSEYHASDRYLYGEAGAFRDGGWVATGDLGRFDDDGFLYIVGRCKDTLVLQSGHKVHPPAVEDRLRRQPAVADCAVAGHARAHLIAVIVPADPAAPDEVLAAAIEAANQAAPDHERVLGFVRAAPFAEGGLLTPTGKLNRGVVVERHAAAIEELFRRG